MDRINGTVKFFNSAKGFGFVQPEDGSKDVFLHVSALERAGIHGLNEGDKITFVLEDDRAAAASRPPRSSSPKRHQRREFRDAAGAIRRHLCFSRAPAARRLAA